MSFPSDSSVGRDDKTGYGRASAKRYRASGHLPKPHPVEAELHTGTPTRDHQLHPVAPPQVDVLPDHPARGYPGRGRLVFNDHHRSSVDECLTPGPHDETHELLASHHNGEAVVHAPSGRQQKAHPDGDETEGTDELEDREAAAHGYTMAPWLGRWDAPAGLAASGP